MARKPAALARELLRNFPKGRRSAKRRRSRKSADPAAVAAGADATGGNERGADAVGTGTVELEDAELNGRDDLDGVELDDPDGLEEDDLDDRDGLDENELEDQNDDDDVDEDVDEDVGADVVDLDDPAIGEKADLDAA